MQIKKRSLGALDPAIFPQIEIEIAFYAGFELFQFQTAQFAVKIILNGSLAHALGQCADGGPHFDAQ